MAKETRIQTQMIRFDEDERLNTYRVLVIAVAQLACRQFDGKEEDTERLTSQIRARIEIAFNTALSAGAFDKAGIFAQALDDVCVELNLFGMTPHKKEIL